MLDFTKKIKAFTLAEIFVTVIVLSVLVSVCLSFYSLNRKDVEREYFYYSAYQNLVKVVENALSNDAYKNTTNTGDIVDSTCRNSKCVIFRKASFGGLCRILGDYYNIVGNKECMRANATPWTDGADPSLTLTNGMQFYFSSQSAEQIPELFVATEPEADYTGWTFWVDINGYGNGKDIENYDIMKFYITLSGKVIPAYGSVEGIRGYETSPLDAAGNASLMSFDVVYTEEDSNVLTVLNDNTRHTDFRTAACTAGYVHQDTQYCSASGASYSAITKDAIKCNNLWAQCQVRLVQKLKRVR